ncbi:MAG: MATE family efflux transporter [Victivallales bacterium]|jgi:MATE family multidrug resistance protein|nr:MATE family efflux transporter [Victivallales bacterium]
MPLFDIRNSFSRQNFICRGGYLEICRIAYPLILMSASNSIMQFVDRWFLAHHSTLDVAAAMPAGILYFTLFCIFMVTCNFTSAMVAQYHGAQDKANLLRAVWAGQILAIASGLFISFVIPLIGLAVLGGTNHDAQIVEREIDYFIALLPSGVFVCFAAPFYSFFSGQGRTLPVAVINIFGCLLNVPLNYMFIFGQFGMPALGIYGAGLATSICSAISAFMIIIYFYAQNQRHIPTRKRWEFHFDLVTKLVRYGTPAGFQTLADVGAFTLLTFLIGDLGPEALAACVIAMSINNIFFVPLTGLADSTAIVVGQYIGKRKPNIAEKAVYRAWRLSAIYAFAGMMIYLIFPEALAIFFSPQQESGIDFSEVVKICTGVLTAAAMFNACDSIKFIFMGGLRGAGDTLAIFLLNSLTAWGVLVPGIFFLTKIYPVSIYHVWGFIAACGFLDAMVFLWRFRTGKWRKVRMIAKHHY